MTDASAATDAIQGALSAAGGTAGGAITIGLIARILIANWIKGHEAKVEKIESAQTENVEKTNDKLTAIQITLGEIKTQISGLQKLADASIEHGKAIAILNVQMTATEKDLNGLGHKLRNMEQS